jgi:hypothetical protein
LLNKNVTKLDILKCVQNKVLRQLGGTVSERKKKVGGTLGEE